jgi:hypothetical protein
MLLHDFNNKFDVVLRDRHACFKHHRFLKHSVNLDTYLAFTSIIIYSMICRITRTFSCPVGKTVMSITESD